MNAPERLTITDPTLRLLVAEGCNANEIAAVAQVPTVAMQTRIDELERHPAARIARARAPNPEA